MYNTNDKKTIPLEYILVKYPAVQPQKFIEERMIYGNLSGIDECVTTSEKRKFLQDKLSDCLSEILVDSSISSVDNFMKLLLELAQSIGEVHNYAKLGQLLGVSGNTVRKYIDILLEHDIIFSIGGYKKKIAEEVHKFMKYYFVDLGLRNAVISSFNTVENRRDQEILWKNLAILEKYRQLNKVKNANIFYWKHYEGYEIDCIVKQPNKYGRSSVKAYNFSYTTKARQRNVPKIFRFNYPQIPYLLVNANNILEFL